MENMWGRAGRERALSNLSWLIMSILAPNEQVIIQSYRERAEAVVLYLKMSYPPGQLMNI